MKEQASRKMRISVTKILRQRRLVGVNYLFSQMISVGSDAL